MLEFLFAIIGFVILATVSWYTDKAKRQDRHRRDYYDG